MPSLNRKTGIPVKSIPEIVEWLLTNSTVQQLVFMNSLAHDNSRFPILLNIFANLTERNVYEVFYAKIKDPTELADYRSAKRGEVAGLKAFSMACQAAGEELDKRRQVKKKQKREEDE